MLNSIAIVIIIFNINRGTRGLPDDFNGDEIVKEVNMKPNRTYGINGGVSGEIFGLDKAGLEKLKVGLVNQPAVNIQQSTAEVKKANDMSKPEIVFDDFAKLELKAATVIACEKVAKADKLLKLEVDLGTEKRIIVSGIAQHYTPEEMVGKQVIVVTNLAPRKMKGIESQGMILTAEDSDGKLQLLKPENSVSPGSNVS